MLNSVVLAFVAFVVAFVVGKVINFFFSTIKRLNLLEVQLKDLKCELIGLKDGVPTPDYLPETDNEGMTDEAE